MLTGIQVSNATSPGADPDSSVELDPQLLTRVVKDTCPQSQQLQRQILQVGKTAEKTVLRNELCHTSTCLVKSG